MLGVAKEKYYAVRMGKIPGVYRTWEECKLQVDGFSGANYKSFPTLGQAEQYLRENVPADAQISQENPPAALNDQITDRISNLCDNEAVAFVDGSFDATEQKSAFGAVIFSANGRKETLFKAFTKELSSEFIALRNVAAELEGVREVVNWAIQYKKDHISIYYDYAGIECWATGEWKAKNKITTDYVRFIQEKQRSVQIEFVKVPAHSGVQFNEEVDSIAKSALLAKGHKTYNDGSVYFIGYSTQDWLSIIQSINEENSCLNSEKAIDLLIPKCEEIGTREKISVSQADKTVVINCYRNSKSYVQGKQTVLFQKIIATAIELLGNSESVVETLNSYHALTLRADEVESYFQQLLPHYRHQSEKHYTNLLSAVYNLMLTGYMPDYTCLVTPAFRAYEYYLHRILGDKMGENTEKYNGSNNFSFFSKNTVGHYECNSKKVSVLTPDQLDYLNTLYTKYNSVRHPYSHWSVSDIDTAVIPDIETARALLKEGLSLFGQYYILF